MSGREDTPSLGIIDSRSIKSSHHVAPDRGIDGNKKIKGRKEHIVVDTLGLPMGVVAHGANIHDGVGAPMMTRGFLVELFFCSIDIGFRIVLSLLLAQGMG